MLLLDHTVPDCRHSHLFVMHTSPQPQQWKSLHLQQLQNITFTFGGATSSPNP
jgi:hypothetical protein